MTVRIKFLSGTFLLTILLATISFIWTGCNKDKEEDLITSVILQKTGTVQLTFSKVSAEDDIDTVTALLTRSGYESIRQDLSVGSEVASGTIYNVSAGLWDLFIEAKDSAGTVLYRGRAGVMIEENRVTYVSINLAPASQSGDLAINISWKQGDGINWTKYAGNPVLDVGAPGSWDETYVLGSTVIFDGTIYKMWFGGFSGTMTKIGYATSPDGINWTKHSGNPVIDKGSSGAWDVNGAGYPTILFDGTSYKMWYTGIGATAVQIGYATSSDGINWNKYSGNPVLTLGASGSWEATDVLNPTVLYDGIIYKMWYAGKNGTSLKIGYATSPDGINWTKYSGNPVLNLGSSWDNTIVNAPTVLYTGIDYRMWFEGSDFTTSKIGNASSLDGINWTKFEENPVVSVGNELWENKQVHHPSVLFNGISYKMWYTGRDSLGTYRIGYATSP